MACWFSPFYRVARALFKTRCRGRKAATAPSQAAALPKDREFHAARHGIGRATSGV